MATAKKRKSFFQKERERLQGLTFRQKLLYIWDYYKFYILALILLVVLVVSLIQSIIKGHDSYDVTCLVPDDYYSEELEFWDTASAVLYPDRDSNRIQQLFPDNSSGATNAGTAYAKLSVMIFSAQIDVIICNQTTYEYLLQNDILADLTTMLPEEALAEYADYYVYGTTDTVLEDTLYALDFASSEYAEAVNLPEEEALYLCIAGNTEHTEDTLALFEYLADGIE